MVFVRNCRPTSKHWETTLNLMLEKKIRSKMSIRMPLYHETSLLRVFSQSKYSTYCTVQVICKAYKLLSLKFTIVVLHKFTNKKMQLLKVLVKEISYKFN